MRFSQILCKITVFCLLIHSSSTLAANSYIKQWDGAVFTGAIANSNYQYYFEPQLRLIADPYIFNQLLLMGALGYRFSPILTVFVGPGWIISKSLSGDISHEVRLWQQVNYSVLNYPAVSLNSRTRLEERKNTQYSQIAYRFRQRFWLRVPLRFNSAYSISIFDEIFFDINHPQWVSPHFISQNRAFAGIGYQFTPAVTMDAGYLNQFLNAKQTQIDHVLFLMFTVNH